MWKRFAAGSESHKIYMDRVHRRFCNRVCVRKHDVWCVFASVVRVIASNPIDSTFVRKILKVVLASAVLCMRVLHVVTCVCVSVGKELRIRSNLPEDLA